MTDLFIILTSLSYMITYICLSHLLYHEQKNTLMLTRCQKEVYGYLAVLCH